ncbi:hypothetical protein J3F83DRAFT_303652 [Trichoderma novae-zelandiae]
MLDQAVPLLSGSSSSPLARHAILYINFCSLAAADGTLEKHWFVSSMVECFSQGMKEADGQASFMKDMGSVLWIEIIHRQRADAIWSLISTSP